MEKRTWQERLVEATREYTRFIRYEDEVNRGFKPEIATALFNNIQHFLRHTGNKCYGVDLSKEFTEPEAREGIKYATVQTVDEFLDFYDAF